MKANVVIALMQIVIQYQKVNGVKSSKAFQSSTFNHHYRETISDWLEHMFSTNTHRRTYVRERTQWLKEASFELKRVSSPHITLLIIFLGTYLIHYIIIKSCVQCVLVQITNLHYILKKGKIYVWMDTIIMIIIMKILNS